MPTKEQLIEKAAMWIYLNLSGPDLDMTEEEKQWWVDDFIDYMNNE